MEQELVKVKKLDDDYSEDYTQKIKDIMKEKTLEHKLFMKEQRHLINLYKMQKRLKDKEEKRLKKAEETTKKNQEKIDSFINRLNLI